MMARTVRESLSQLADKLDQDMRNLNDEEKAIKDRLSNITRIKIELAIDIDGTNKQIDDINLD